MDNELNYTDYDIEKETKKLESFLKTEQKDKKVIDEFKKLVINYRLLQTKVDIFYDLMRKDKIKFLKV